MFELELSKQSGSPLSFNSMEVTAREALWAILVTGGLLGVPF